VAGQGSITIEIGKKLREDGWDIAFLCIPNTVHLNVIPIPTLRGGSKQRYPDIVAFKNGITRFIEVEMKLNHDIYEDIVERFSDFISSLSKDELWNIWRLHVQEQLRIKTPEVFIPQCDLVICGKIGRNSLSLVEALLNKHNITVSTIDTFVT
jgi:hypothetical protein